MTLQTTFPSWKRLVDLYESFVRKVLGHFAQEDIQAAQEASAVPLQGFLSLRQGGFE